MTDNEPKKPSNYTMIRIKKDIKEIAKHNADKDHRSIANYVENLILKDKKRRNGTTSISTGNKSNRLG